MTHRLPAQYDVTLQTPEDSDPINRSLTEGFRPYDLRDTNSVPHPVAQLQTKDLHRAEQRRLQLQAAIFGLHAPFQHLRERLAVAQARRLPPHSSSLLSLDILLGQDTTLDFSDYLSRDNPEEVDAKKCVHALMQERVSLGHR